MRFINSRSGKLRALAAVFAVVGASLAIGAAPAAAADGGAVFTMTNDSAGNAVMVYARAGDGTLSLVDSVSTGGLGTGAGLGSQGAVTLSDDGSWLFVVNAGSNSLSLFSVDGTDLTLTDVEATGGDTPISVDAHGNLAFVVDAGSSNIEGFWVNDGDLSPVRGSMRSLSGKDVGPAQIEFSPNGRTLAVTEKATNLIDTFRVARNGRVGPAQVSPAAGATPFGFEFDRSGRLVVSEAVGGAPDASLVSTYWVSRGAVSEIDTQATTQTAACWVAITENGRYVYTTNTGSASVTSLRLNRDGSLTLLGQTAVGAGPIDLDFSAGDGFLYVLNAASHSISVLAASSDGSLSPIETISGLPASTVGLAAS